MSIAVRTSNTFKVNKAARSNLNECDPTNLSWDEMEKGSIHKYEYLGNHSICRLFFDLDFEHDYFFESNVSFDEVNIELSNLLNENRNAFKGYEFVVTDGTVDGKKHSFHVIFKSVYIHRHNGFDPLVDARGILENMVLANVPPLIKNTILKVKHSEKGTYVVDKSVYQEGRFMRLPHAEDADKPVPHKPIDGGDESKPCDYFITFIPENVDEKRIIGKPKSSIPKKVVEDGDEKVQPNNGRVRTDEDRQKMLEQLEMIKKERFIEREPWLHLACLMKSNGLPLTKFLEYSKSSGYTNYNEDECVSTWQSLTEREETFGFPKIREWLKEDGIELEEDSSIVKDLLKLWALKGHFVAKDIAELIVKYMGDELYLTQIGWIYWTSTRGWRITDKNDTKTVSSVVIDTFYPRFNKYAYHGYKKRKNDPQDDKEFARLQKSIRAAADSLGSCSFIEGCIAAKKDSFINEEVVKEFDAHPHLFAFADFQAIDLNNGAIVQIDKTHKMLTTCGYKMPNRDQSLIDKVKKFIKSLVLTDEEMKQPEPSQKKYNALVSQIATFFYGKYSQYFYVWTGEGGNGKSLLATLLTGALGNYHISSQVEQLTQDSHSKNEANSGLAACRGKRLSQYNEPDGGGAQSGEKETTLKINTIKLLTGDEWIPARDLFGKQFQMRNTFSQLMLANDIPKLSRTDEAIKRRLRIQKFPFLFKENPSDEIPCHKKADKSLNMSVTTAEWGHALMWIATDAYCANKGKIDDNDDEESKQALSDVLDNSNPIAAWTRSCLDVQTADQCLYKPTKEDGYIMFPKVADLKDECNKRAKLNLTAQQFKRYLESLGFQVVVGPQKTNHVQCKWWKWGRVEEEEDAKIDIIDNSIASTAAVSSDQ